MESFPFLLFRFRSIDTQLDVTNREWLFHVPVLYSHGYYLSASSSLVSSKRHLYIYVKIFTSNDLRQ